MPNIYKYRVWVGGVYDSFKTYNEAEENYNYWIANDYDDVTLETINY